MERRHPGGSSARLSNLLGRHYPACPAAARQRAERGVEVVEARIGEIERNASRAEAFFDHGGGRLVGAEAAAHPECPAMAVPQTVARAFEHGPVRHLDDLVDQAARLED